jgi:repressor LexA
MIELTPGASRGIRLSDTAKARGLEQKNIEHPLIPQLVLPLVGRVAAGSPILSEEHIEASYSVDPSLFTSKPDYLLKVRGMSMRDIGIFEGDLLAVKKTNQAINGQIVVARIGDEVTVKRFKKTGSLIELFPENPDYNVIKVESEDFSLEGLAVGLLRRWN